MYCIVYSVLYTVASGPAVTGLLSMRRFKLFWDSVATSPVLLFNIFFKLSTKCIDTLPILGKNICHRKIIQIQAEQMVKNKILCQLHRLLKQ